MQAPRESTVAIIGGGFAGAHAASQLLANDVDVTIIEPTGHHQFLTRLAAVAGGTQPTGDAAVALTDMFGSADIIEDEAQSIDGTSVHLASGDTIEAEHVIITAGARPVEPPLPGLEYSLPLRSASDALAIRNVLARSADVVIVGGGPTGCQLAGAIATAHPEITVTVVDGGSRLMSAFAPSLGRRAAEILESRGVRTILGREAAAIDSDGVELEGGSRRSGTVLWAAGFDTDMSHFGTTDDGRLVLDDAGRLDGEQFHWAAGDCAAHSAGGEALPMSAQVAAQAGSQVASNILRVLAGDDARPLNLKDRGWVVDLGGGQGVAEVLGVPLAIAPLDRIVPLLHHAIDLRNLFQLGGIDFVRRFRPGQSAHELHPPLDPAAVEVLDTIGIP